MGPTRVWYLLGGGAATAETGAVASMEAGSAAAKAVGAVKAGAAAAVAAELRLELPAWGGEE